MLSRTALLSARRTVRPSPVRITRLSRFPNALLQFSSTSLSPSSSSPSPPPPSRRPPPPPPHSRDQYRRAQQAHYKERNRSLLLYSAATILLVTASSYLAVPLYRVFCSTTGYAGTPVTDPSKFLKERLVARTDLDKRIKVEFNADSSDSLPWTFTPQQKEVRVLPGETALAFYTAKNLSEEDIIGIATYNVTPNNIAPYFAKVECFCFEEQRILAGEEVDLPVFFFIDRDFVDDPLMKDVREVTLSYTFFRARRDSHGNLVPSEGPLAVEGSVPAV
ncbi:Cox11p [Sporobolomyces salmoneus]|uniref:Cox11p n=1 Tax=Sporobolomyces salmoneus TaxID=183962 RepID=UPI00316D2484